MNIENLFDIKPQIANEEYGTEPSLRDIILYYYVHHEIIGMAEKFTEEYISAILRVSNE